MVYWSKCILWERLDGMPKFFVRSEQIKGGIIRVEGPDFDHIVKVRRGAKGQAVTLSDENGFDYSAEICEIGSDFFLASILDKQRDKTEAINSKAPNSTFFWMTSSILELLGSAW